jgi:hypothetical protein
MAQECAFISGSKHQVKSTEMTLQLPRITSPTAAAKTLASDDTAAESGMSCRNSVLHR